MPCFGLFFCLCVFVNTNSRMNDSAIWIYSTMIGVEEGFLGLYVKPKTVLEIG